MGYVMRFLNYLDDILIVAGCGLILVGTYLVNPLAVWFVGGAQLIILGVLIGLGARHDHP